MRVRSRAKQWPHRVVLPAHHTCTIKKVHAMDDWCRYGVIGPGTILEARSILWGTNMPQEWRSETAYAYLNDLTPAELAWEFLRRNPEYQRDYRAAADATADQAELSESLIAQWGLRFRDPSGSSGGQRPDRLAGTSRSKRRPRRTRAGTLQKRRSDRRARTSIRAPRRRRRVLARR